MWACRWQEFTTKVRAAIFLPTLSTVGIFFHSGAPFLPSTAIGEAEVVFLSIRTFQREIGDDRCVNGPSSFFTRSVIYPALVIYAQPGLALTHILAQLKPHVSIQAKTVCRFSNKKNEMKTTVKVFL